MFARLTGDVRTAAATGGHALLSAASFRRGLPTFPRHSQGSREHSAFSPFFFARILLFLNLFPVGLFTAAVYKHRANQNERAIADTLDLPVQPQRNKTLRPSPVCPPASALPPSSPCSCALGLWNALLTRYTLNSLGAIFCHLLLRTKTDGKCL